MMMRLLFYPIQWLDGFGAPRDNGDGLLPGLIEAAGFEDVHTRKSINIVFGNLAFHQSSRKKISANVI